MGLTVKGAVSLLTGAGAETTTIADVVFAGAFTTNFGDGADTLSIETNNSGIESLFRGPVSIALGDGADTANIGNNNATGRARFLGPVKIDGGGGADTTNVKSGAFGNIYPAGQPVFVSVETEN